jgi:hypothetical protein
LLFNRSIESLCSQIRSESDYTGFFEHEIEYQLLGSLPAWLRFWLPMPAKSAPENRQKNRRGHQIRASGRPGHPLRVLGPAVAWLRNW